MSLDKYLTAFDELLKDLENCSPAERLVRYAAARTILEEFVAAAQEHTREFRGEVMNYTLVLSKLKTMMGCFQQAALPEPGVNVNEKIKSARMNLEKAGQG